MQVPPDQAAGLRRRRAGRSPRCLHTFLGSADSTRKLLEALHRSGLRTLLIDTTGRGVADSSARSLFGWRQQLARGQLQILPMPYGDGWHAPGARADAPGLAELAQGYDLLVFDEGVGETAAGMPGAARTAIVELAAANGSLQRGYALLKTLFHQAERTDIVLLGESAACDRVRAACAQFLDAGFAQAIFSAAHEDDAFAALAVRMADEETGRASVNKTGNT
jgi:hypothetical protein